MRRALVTGATGFIGSHVARHLRDAGFEVRGLVHPGGAPASTLPDGGFTNTTSSSFGLTATATARATTDVTVRVIDDPETFFRDKPGGLVVDYLGLADQLKKALITYTDEETRKLAIEWATGYAKEAVDGFEWTAPEGYTITFHP